MNCSGCFHSKGNHKPIEGYDNCHICTGSLECRCEKYEEPYLAEFAQDIEKQKATCRTIKQRCEYILKNIPPMRNAGEKSFGRVYREIWYNFKVRKQNSSVLNMEEFRRMPHDDSINREKRRVKENPMFATYEPKVIKKQMAIFEAYMELAVEQ